MHRLVTSKMAVKDIQKIFFKLWEVLQPTSGWEIEGVVLHELLTLWSRGKNCQATHDADTYTLPLGQEIWENVLSHLISPSLDSNKTGFVFSESLQNSLTVSCNRFSEEDCCLTWSRLASAMVTKYRVATIAPNTDHRHFSSICAVKLPLKLVAPTWSEHHQYWISIYNRQIPDLVKLPVRWLSTLPLTCRAALSIARILL